MDKIQVERLKLTSFKRFLNKLKIKSRYSGKEERFKPNTAQTYISRAMLFNRQEGLGSRVNLVRARQVGATSIISALAFYDMVSNPGNNVLVLTHPKTGESNLIYNLYRDFWSCIDSEEDCIANFPHFNLPNGSTVTVHNSYSEARDHLGLYNFIHCSNFTDEKGFDELKSYFIDMEPHKSIVVESNARGISSADLWVDNAQIMTAMDLPNFFIPWYACDWYRQSFKMPADRYDFEDKIPEVLKELGDPFSIPTPGIPVVPAIGVDEQWMEHWEGIYFDGYEVDTEKIKWYYDKFKEPHFQESDYPNFSFSKGV